MLLDQLQKVTDKEKQIRRRGEDDGDNDDNEEFNEGEVAVIAVEVAAML